jgi:hypothetical protein
MFLSPILDTHASWYPYTAAAPGKMDLSSRTETYLECESDPVALYNYSTLKNNYSTLKFSIVGHGFANLNKKMMNVKGSPMCPIFAKLCRRTVLMLWRVSLILGLRPVGFFSPCSFLLRGFHHCLYFL